MPTTAAADESPDLGREAMAVKVLHVAWMSIIAALLIQGALVALQVAYGTDLQNSGIITELAGKVSWSALVCMAIAAGTAASRARPAIMGMLGLLAAPAAFIAAKAIQKAVGQALNAPSGPPQAPAVWVMMVIKAVEYGLFGLLIGWVGRKPWGNLGAHAAAGLALGLIFAGVVLTLTVTGSPETPPGAALAAKGLNEALFPLGCAMVVYLAGVLGQKALGKAD